MANTRKATKRAKQALVRQARNQRIRSLTKTALKSALDSIKKKDAAGASEAYHLAMKTLNKAASKGAIPQGRASRKMSRLTHFAKKSFPEALKAAATAPAKSPATTK